MGDQVWTHSAPIPHINMCEDVSGYGGDYIKGEIQRLSAGGVPSLMFGAARAWNAAASKLDALKQAVNEVSQNLSGAWNSEDSVAAQRALQRIHRTAAELAISSREVYNFTDSSAASLENAIATFPSGDGGPGFMENLGRTTGGIAGIPGGPVPSFVASEAGGLVGRGLDTIGDALGIGGEDPNEKPRQALADLNLRYQADNTRLPYQVSAELPMIAGSGQDYGGVQVGGTLVSSGPGGGSLSGVPLGGGGPSTSVSTGPGSGGEFATSGSTAQVSPDAYGGFEANDPATPDSAYEGYGGGLAGATPVTVPGGPGVGGLGGGPSVPGTGGVGGAGAGIGGVGAVGAGGVGAVMPGAGGGMVPMGGGGAAGGGGARSAGAGRTMAGGGRPGAAGGMMPMGAGRSTGENEADRDTWLVEDDDPWGADTEAPPGVIT